MRSARRRRLFATVGGAVSLALTSSALLALPSFGATGNAGLGRHLIGDPIAQGVTLPSSVLSSYYTSFVNQQNSSASSGVSELVAVNGWRNKHHKQQILFIALIAVTGKGKTASYLNFLAASTAASAGKTACNGAGTSTPAVDVPISNLSNSYYVRCQATSGGAVVVATTTTRKNVVAILLTTSTTLSQTALTNATRHQYGLLPKAGFGE